MLEEDDVRTWRSRAAMMLGTANLELSRDELLLVLEDAFRMKTQARLRFMEREEWNEVEPALDVGITALLDTWATARDR